jgi:hypothetical protein
MTSWQVRLSVPSRTAKPKMKMIPPTIMPVKKVKVQSAASITIPSVEIFEFTVPRAVLTKKNTPMITSEAIILMVKEPVRLDLFHHCLLGMK